MKEGKVGREKERVQQTKPKNVAEAAGMPSKPISSSYKCITHKLHFLPHLHVTDHMSSSGQRIVRVSNLLCTVKWEKFYRRVLSPCASFLPCASWSVQGKPWSVYWRKGIMLQEAESLNGCVEPRFTLVPPVLDQELKRTICCVNLLRTWNCNCN